MLRQSLLALVLVAACSNNKQQPDAGVACPPCVIDSDCVGGGVCSQLGGDSYCAMPCPNGDECTASQQCLSVVTISGDQASVCVDPSSTQCGPNPPDDNDAGTACPGFADPSTTSSCTSCTTQSRPDCQANGCYGGWYCNLQTTKCQAPPSCQPLQDAGPPPTIYDGGVTSTIGSTGGTESVLYFGVVGDTRPATEDDTAHYPTAIIGTIFNDLSGVTPQPPFVVSTGDYQFSNPNGAEAANQLKLYVAARGPYTGVQFPAMGNHECTGATASNCGSGNANGLTNNYKEFMSQLLGPLQQTSPYYVIDVSATDSSWTAKFVFVAANAWDQTQATWFDTAMAQPTTYTFVVRHESASANTAPGVTPSEAIMANHPYTLAIVGHSHEYQHSKFSHPKEVIIGNGGAPLALNQNYGYAIIAQRTDGSLQVDMFDYQTQQPDTSFRFAVKADGTPAP
jgi:hypothetical protein